MALKATTKACERCGGLFVPTGNRQKYCPACRAAMNDLSEKKAARDLEAAFGPKESAPGFDVTVCEDDLNEATFQPVTVSVTPEEIAEEIADQVHVETEPPAQSVPHEPVSFILDVLEAWYDMKLIPAEELTPYKVTAGEDILFDGYAWKKGASK